MAYRYNTDEERIRAVYEYHLRQVELHQQAAAEAARQFRDLTGADIRIGVDVRPRHETQ